MATVQECLTTATHARFVVCREAGEVRIPEWVRDFETFRRWAREQRPENLRVGYFDGTIWIDPTMEQAYTHNLLKTVIAAVLLPLARPIGRGEYFGDGMQLSLPSEECVTIPDGMFVSDAAFDSGRIREVPGHAHGFTEFEGPPDMILEVVSDSSVSKDTVTLAGAYFRAGVNEYWRVDARGEPARFEILRRGDVGFVPVDRDEDWWRSELFGRWFRLVQATNPRGRPTFRLEHRE